MRERVRYWTKEILGVAIKTLALLALAALCWLALYLSPGQMSGEYDWAVEEGRNLK